MLSPHAPSFEQDAENQPDDHGRKPEEGLVNPRHLRQHGLTILHRRPVIQLDQISTTATPDRLRKEPRPPSEIRHPQ
jgi:hypothetical protein